MKETNKILTVQVPVNKNRVKEGNVYEVHENCGGMASEPIQLKMITRLRNIIV